MHYIERLARTIDPDALEHYLAALVGDAEPMGRIEDAWHITDRRYRPALLLCSARLTSDQNCFSRSIIPSL